MLHKQNNLGPEIIVQKLDEKYLLGKTLLDTAMIGAFNHAQATAKNGSLLLIESSSRNPDVYFLT